MHSLLYMSLVVTAMGINVPVQPRTDPSLVDVENNEFIQMDGPTADNTAGIGAEFESPFFQFKSEGCSAKDTDASKGQVIAQRTGTNWKLTADSINSPGQVNAEYILNGENIKVGSGDGAKVGKAWADDLVSDRACNATKFCPVNIVRSRGSLGLEIRQTWLILQIVSAIRGKFLPKENRRT